jgi:hypothetical protein
VRGQRYECQSSNQPVDNTIGTNGENILNKNGQHLIDFAVYNGLKITNTFLKNKNIHKFTWNARGNKSIIDYVLVNQNMTTMVTDTRVYRGTDVHSGHFLFISKISK